MPQLDPLLVKERAARLRAAGAAALKSELSARIGRDSDVLIEAPGRGRADCYAAVRFDRVLDPGTVARMRFAAAEGDTLMGVPVV
jgi:threonylcarbamoyladenosine tRNA methylthiotransferase MtaB